MNWVDYTIIGVLVISVVISLFRGLVREVMALVVWVAAFWVAFAFADRGQVFLVNTVDLPSARLAIAFGLLFILTLALGALLNYLIGQLIDHTGLTGTDRVLGMFFGAARGLVVITVAVLLGGLTPLPEDPWWQESRLMPRFESLALWVADFLPEDFRSHFDYDPELIEESQSGDNTPVEATLRIVPGD